jgi:hypothetical protein
VPWAAAVQTAAARHLRAARPLVPPASMRPPSSRPARGRCVPAGPTHGHAGAPARDGVGRSARRDSEIHRLSKALLVEWKEVEPAAGEPARGWDELRVELVAELRVREEERNGGAQADGADGRA